MSIRVAIASDFHCHPSTVEPTSSFFLSDAPWLPASHHPIASLIEMIDHSSLSADVLLIPGDLTDRINRQGLRTAWDAVGNLRRALSADLLAATIGNHDVDSRAVHGGDPFQLAREFDPRFPAQSEENKRRFWSDGFFWIDNAHVRILVVNSVADHLNEEEAKRLLAISNG